MDIAEKTTAEATSFAEHKAIRKALEEKTTAPVAEKPDTAPLAEKVDAAPVAEKPEDAPVIAETPGDSEKKPTQETKERPVDRRFSELTRARKDAEERANRLEEELRTLRTRKPEESKPEPKAEPTDKQPVLAEYLANPKEGEKYEDVLQRWEEDRFKWRSVNAERERKQSEAKAAHEVRLAKAKEKHPDLEERVRDAIEQTGNLQNKGIEAALSESDDLGDLLYHLATNVDEYRRIAALSPEKAYRAIVALEVKLSNPVISEKPKPQLVTRAPNPPPNVNGAGSSSDVLSTKNAKTFKDHQRAMGRTN